MAQPLHLATHGFYLAGVSHEPLLSSGIALAGANRVLVGAGMDGVLFAFEAQGLNLEGTELVVLSASDGVLGQGSLDYSEGVFGLARALRTAGARNVLVTLWDTDGEARDFMVEFYKTWLLFPFNIEHLCRQRSSWPPLGFCLEPARQPRSPDALKFSKVFVMVFAVEHRDRRAG
jgi:hypothetical protein